MPTEVAAPEQRVRLDLGFSRALVRVIPRGERAAVRVRAAALLASGIAADGLSETEQTPLFEGENQMACRRLLHALVTSLLVFAFGASRALAHCDTVDGPVVKDAMVALDSRDVTPVLKWVTAEREWEIRRLFAQTLAVRGLGPEARAVADRLFFENLVRIHREGEGALYTGLKAAGTEAEPAIAASDRALETGTVEALVKMVTVKVEQGIRERYKRAAEARAHADENVQRGREYVAAYVAFMHYAERLHGDAVTTPRTAQHGDAGDPSPTANAEQKSGCSRRP